MPTLTPAERAELRDLVFEISEALLATAESHEALPEVRRHGLERLRRATELLEATHTRAPLSELVAFARHRAESRQA